MSDVVMATYAAQTFFPLHYFSSPKMTGHFVDGGMWANDPTMVGITEALNFFVGKEKEYDRYEVLSIGNINENTHVSSWSNKYFWNISNMSYMVNTFFNSNSQSVRQYCKTISNIQTVTIKE